MIGLAAKPSGCLAFGKGLGCCYPARDLVERKARRTLAVAWRFLLNRVQGMPAGAK